MKFFISDLKRNINPLVFLFMEMTTVNKLMKKGFVTSVNAAYLKNEIENLLSKSELKNFTITKNTFGFIISGKKGE